MAEIIYTPKKGDSEQCRMFGMTFTANSPISVDDQRIVDKLSTNPYFVVSTKPKAEEPKAKEPKK